MTVPNEPVPNLPLLRKILDHIDAHPEEHWQGDWQSSTYRRDCGTTRCVAGWALYFTGQDQVLNEGDALTIEDASRDALGLTYAEAASMFYGALDATDVRVVAEAIAARAGEVL